MMTIRGLTGATLLVALSLFLGMPALAHAGASTVVVSADGQHGWHSRITDSNGVPDPSFGKVTFVTGPGIPPLGVGSLRLQTNPGKGDGSAQLRNTNYAGVKLLDLTELTYWAYSAANNGQQFPYLTLAVSYSTGTDTLFFEPPYQQPFTGNPSCPDQGPTAMNMWQKWDARNGCWWDNNGELGIPPGGLLQVQPLSTFTNNHPDAVIYNPNSIGGVRVAVGFASSTDSFDGNVDALTIAHPTTKTTYNFEPPCQESDGNGDFQGQQKANFNVDNDGCMDGDQNQVSSTNRGDGKTFQSTRIDTTTFDSVAHKLTITGVGVSGGVPVTFVFVALETGPTTPGWVSFAFSDGYTNAGTLVSGSILLH
jgi:hypothetical protein